MSGDTLTIVQARGRRLAKLVRANGSTKGYDNAKTVDLHHTSVADLDALVGLLRDLAFRRDCCIVRGAVINPAHTTGVRRLSRPDHGTGESPTLREAARQWLGLDVDGVPLPPSIDVQNLEACAQAAVRRMPEPFHSARAVVQATASHGVKPGARLRLWYWCTRPLTNAECRAWLLASPVDRSLFTPAQPHYTAAPIFDGCSDPLPRRFAMLGGDAHVVPPTAEVLTPPAAPAQSPARPAVALGRFRGRDSTARLAGLLGRVRRAPEGQRHRALFWAACRAGEMVTAGELGAEAAVRVLVQAAVEAGGRDWRNAEATARDGIARGMAEAHA